MCRAARSRCFLRPALERALGAAGAPGWSAAGTRGRCLLASLTHQLLPLPQGEWPGGCARPTSEARRTAHHALLLAKANPGREGAGGSEPGQPGFSSFPRDHRLPAVSAQPPSRPRCAQPASQAGHPNPHWLGGSHRLQPALMLPLALPWRHGKQKVTGPRGSYLAPPLTSPRVKVK